MRMYRGKSKVTGEWAYGWYYRFETDGVISHNIYRDKENDYYVDHKTVGQYTGLKDKNGVEICEGDIVHCTSQWDNANMVVIFEEGEFRMILCEKYKDYETGAGFYALRSLSKEIIGNIHDTELGEGVSNAN